MKNSHLIMVGMGSLVMALSNPGTLWADIKADLDNLTSTSQTSETATSQDSSENTTVSTTSSSENTPPKTSSTSNLSALLDDLKTLNTEASDTATTSESSTEETNQSTATSPEESKTDEDSDLFSNIAAIFKNLKTNNTSDSTATTDSNQEKLTGKVNIALVSENGALQINWPSQLSNQTIESGQYTVAEFLEKSQPNSLALLKGLDKVNNGLWTSADFKQNLDTELAANDLARLKSLQGYTLDENKLAKLLSSKITFSDKAANFKIELPFIKNDAKTIIHYVNTDGTKVADDLVIQGVAGLSHGITITSPIISGQYTKELTTKINFTKGIQEITVTYQKVGQIVIHFTDEAGKKIADDLVLIGKLGDDFKLEAKKLADFDLTNVIGELSGKYQTTKQEITLVYQNVAAKTKKLKADLTKIKEDINRLKSSDLIKTSGSLAATSVTAQPKSNTTTASASLLPKTGSQATAWMSLLGASLIGLTGLIIVKLRK